MANLNFKENTLFIQDNLKVLEGINSNTVDLIYMDPPFNSNRNYESPVGEIGKIAKFKDVWSWDDADETWLSELSIYKPELAELLITLGKINGRGSESYLLMMAMRLIECHRILKNTGSLYLHVDPTMSHSLKIVLDGVFGKKNFRNEIIWAYGGSSNTTKDFPKKHDVILRYSKSNTFTFNVQYGKHTETTLKRYNKVDENGRKYMITKLKGKDKKFYLSKGSKPNTIWSDLPILKGNMKESFGYPTQKPIKLLKRIVKASSNEGDIIMDPFCGGGGYALSRPFIG